MGWLVLEGREREREKETSGIAPVCIGRGKGVRRSCTRRRIVSRFQFNKTEKKRGKTIFVGG